MNYSILALGIVVAICSARQPLRPPRFLQEASSEAKKEYYDILNQSENDTIAQQDEKFLAWAKKNNVKAYMDLKNIVKEVQEKFNKEVKSLISNLPSAYSEFNKIFTNFNQTSQEMQKSIVEFRGKHPKEHRIIMFIEGLIVRTTKQSATADVQ